MKGVGAGGRLGDANRRQRNNFGTPWQESRGRLRGGGDFEIPSCSRSWREGGEQVGKSEFWGGDRRRPCGQITSCGRRRCWNEDGERPGGWINSCGRYGGIQSIRGGGVVVHNNMRQCLRLEQSLAEAWNPTTTKFGHIDWSGDRLTYTTNYGDFLYFGLFHSNSFIMLVCYLVLEKKNSSIFTRCLLHE